jgi:pilus assembly protein CpaF
MFAEDKPVTPLDIVLDTLELLVAQVRAVEVIMAKNEYLEALGPLASLYLDPDIYEIMVDAYDKVIVDRKDRLVATDIKFESPDALRTMIDKLMALGGINLDLKKTSGHLRFPDASRCLAVIPPTAVDGPYLVIRKTRSAYFSMQDLIGFGSVTKEQYALLKSALQTRQNILIAGGTGSGKTTFANVLTDDFPEDERVVVVESVYELQPRLDRFVRLSADSSPDHSMQDLVILASKMRPDRLIVGELHGPEAFQTLNIFNMGHDGSLTILHANSPEDSLSRLETMCLMANLGLGLNEIRTLIASALQLLTYQELLIDGSRKITHIVELCGLENGRYMLQPLFRYNPQTREIESTGNQPSWMK